MSTLSTPHKYGVIIIGAGVAGASAAYELANSGVNVTVLEKERLPRHKKLVQFSAKNIFS
ncbi:MAG: FAD-dependent oxidoreductase [Ignavibacteriaceae bacterium]